MPPSEGGSAALEGARAELARLVDGGGTWAQPWRHAIGTVDASAARAAAVLVLFGALDDVPATSTAGLAPRDLDVLLLARAASLGNHPGQVAFPGGRVDPQDADAIACALREAVEETGLDASGVEVLGTYDPLPLPVSNHLVTPVLAWWTRRSPVRVVDPGESAHVFRVPVADLLEPAHRSTVEVRRGARRFRSPGFLVAADGREHLVWGFTAGILDALFDELGWTVPWDRERIVPAPL